jgi:hypothetical protein
MPPARAAERPGSAGWGPTLGALRKVAGGGNGAIEGAAAALFTRRNRSPHQRQSALARGVAGPPALAQAGLLSGRVIYVKAGDDKAPASRKGCVTAVPAPLLPK